MDSKWYGSVHVLCCSLYSGSRDTVDARWGLGFLSCVYRGKVSAWSSPPGPKVEYDHVELIGTIH